MIQEFLSVLFSPQLILQFKEGFQWFYEGYRGGPLFSGRGVQLFPGGWGGGVQMLIYIVSIETHICTCYFPGGVRTPYPPLDPLDIYHSPASNHNFQALICQD